MPLFKLLSTPSLSRGPGRSYCKELRPTVTQTYVSMGPSLLQDEAGWGCR